MNEVRPYAAYKDTGLKWLGQVPVSWGIAPLWTLYSRGKSTNFPDEELLSVYRDHGVVPKNSRDDNFNKPSDDLSSYQLVQPGDMVINKMKAWQGSVAISRHRGIVSPAYFVYERHHSMDDRYLHYLLRSERYITGYLSLSKGIRINQWDLDPTYHSRMPVLVPSIQEQRGIVDLLDRETAQIDQLIDKQERLIELLAEKRQTIIARAVVKGLDPTALTKPSGEPWIGDVPEHWSLPRLKNCSQVKRGRFMHRPRNAPHLYDGKYPFIQTGAIARAQGKYITEYSQTLSEAGLATSALMPQGTLVMAIAANIADVAVLSFDSCAPDSVLGFQPTNRTSPDFLYYALTAKRAELISEAPVTSQGNLNVERVGGVTIPLPPIREQQKIVKKLDEELEQMAQISSKASGMLRLLSERRSALISAAVTGKIDLRKEAS